MPPAAAWRNSRPQTTASPSPTPTASRWCSASTCWTLPRPGAPRACRSVVISGGYIQRDPLEELCRSAWTLSRSISRRFSEKFYKEVVNGELKPVLETLATIRKQGIWNEIVYLVIPTLNDSDQEFRGLARWVKTELGPDVPAALFALPSRVPAEEPAGHPGGDAGARQGHLRCRGPALRVHRQRARTSGREHLLPEVPPRRGGARGVHGAGIPHRAGQVPVLPDSDSGSMWEGALHAWQTSGSGTGETVPRRGVCAARTPRLSRLSHGRPSGRLRLRAGGHGGPATWRPAALARWRCCCWCSAQTRAGEAPAPAAVRPAAVAGSSIRPIRRRWREHGGRLIAGAKQAPLDAVALVSPHAGYEYAGPVAAYTYASLKGRKIDRVVIIAPSHYEAFGFSSVFDGAAYTTPLGRSRWTAPSPRSSLPGRDRSGFRPRATRPRADKPEHSIEVRACLSRNACCRAVPDCSHHHGEPELRGLPRVGPGFGEAAPEVARHAHPGEF